MNKFEKQLSATLKKIENKGGRTYVVWPESIDFFKTRGLVKMKGTIDGNLFKVQLPVNIIIRKIKKEDDTLPSFI